MKEVHCTTEEGAIHAATTQLQELLADNDGRPVVLLLSGGSALQLLETLDVTRLPQNLTVMMLDERFDDDPEVNNFFQLQDTAFYGAAVAQGVQFVSSIPEETESVGDFAQRMEDLLRSVVTEDAVVLATMGVGADGHTAGIMPYPEDPIYFRDVFDDDMIWVAGYDAGRKSVFSERITVTLPFLRNHVEHAVVFAAGEEKIGALEQVTTEDGTLHDTPARIIREMKGIILVTSD